MTVAYEPDVSWRKARSGAAGAYIMNMVGGLQNSLVSVLRVGRPEVDAIKALSEKREIINL